MATPVFPQPGAVTPGEYGPSVLGWVGGFDHPQNPEVALTRQLVEDAVPTATAANLGRVASTKAALSGLKNVRPFGLGGGVPVTTAIEGLPSMVKGVGVPLAIQLATGFGSKALGGSEFGKEHPDAATALSKIGGGAAIGAGLGSFIPGLGTVAGGLAGGAVGGLQAIFSQPTKSMDEKLAEAEGKTWQQLGGMGIDAKTLTDVQQEYNVLKNTQSPEAAQNYISQVAQYAQSQQKLPGLPDPNTGMDPARILAVQQQVTSLMAPYMERQAAASDAGINAMMQYATPEGQKISAATQHLGNMYKAGNQEITNAYILQAQGAPFLNMLESSTYNAGLKAQQGGGGSSSLADILAQAPAQ